jgi:hypothetical protein
LKTTIERARAYLSRIPGAISGSGGHGATFHVACILVQGFSFSAADALPLLEEWNATCQPPWTPGELRHKLKSAEVTTSTKPRGYLLGDRPEREEFRPSHARVGTPMTPAPVASVSTEPEAEPERPLPDRTGFGPGTADQIAQLAALRPYHREGLDWANERGVLVFAAWREFTCHGLTDASGRVLELRRMDGEPFPAVLGTALRERKSHAVKGSQKAWPLGILEARDFPAIALVEGLPDFLTAHAVALWEQASHHDARDARCAPVAMLSASPKIHAEALPHFRGKRVRIFAHAERAGLVGADRWQAQLRGAGATQVDLFDFSAWRKADGAPVNDLWDFVHSLREEDHANPLTWKIMP